MHDITPDDAVADVLTAAGFDIVRCAEPGTVGFPCRGAEGSCPLDGSIDVAVVVHDRPSLDLTPGEVGVVCALRDGVPVVVAGNHTHSAYRGQCDAEAADVDDIVAACRRAMAAAQHRASDFVSNFAGVPAEVTRQGHAIAVQLPVDATERHAVLAHQATTRMFPSARTIDVTKESST
jgi:hypothetical protein